MSLVTRVFKFDLLSEHVTSFAELRLGDCDEGNHDEENLNVVWVRGLRFAVSVMKCYIPA